MPVSTDEIDSFVEFAKDLTRRSGAGSLEECLRLWREHQETEETVADVLRGVADIEAGRYSSLEEADAWIRARSGMPKRE